MPQRRVGPVKLPRGEGHSLRGCECHQNIVRAHLTNATGACGAVSRRASLSFTFALTLTFTLTRTPTRTHTHTHTHHTHIPAAAVASDPHRCASSRPAPQAQG